MPEPIIKGIIYHHSPELGNDAVCDAVYLANVVAKHVQAQMIGSECAQPIDPQTAKRLKSELSNLERLCTESIDRFTTIGARYNAT